MRLEVTRKSELAVRVLQCLASSDGLRKGADLAASVHSSPGFLAQTISPLAQRGWVTSDPGPAGGYRLVADPATITLLDVIEAVEGPIHSKRCVVSKQDCGRAGQCLMHHSWHRARRNLTESLSAIAVLDADLPVPAPAPTPTSAKR
ncbi:MAG: Rrf2 family transcriptional regulator [Actinobacteria bacterium]|nr:Rrf2 family transcriptional regulator [Actinomycetota bacterium]MCB9388211.1 Rrf2 family transcriptional regulator [Acidimicrobiia bacterium]